MTSAPLPSEIQQGLHRASALALSMRQNLVLPHHLLLSLMEHPRVIDILGQYAQLEPLRDAVQKEAVQAFPVAHEGYPFSAQVLFSHALNQVLLTAHGFKKDPRQMDLGDILIALTLVEHEGVAGVLRQHNLGRLEMAQAVAHAPPTLPMSFGRTAFNLASEQAGRSAPAPSADSATADAAAKTGSALAQFALDLNARAAQAKMDPLIGRTLEVDRMVQILARRKKNNPLLVGEPGVGKTALAEGLAQRIVQGQVPDSLARLRLFSLNTAALVAGTKYRGDFEQRVQNLLDEMRQRPEVVLVVDEIHTMLGAGAASGSSLDVANLFKPALASGELRVIGTTTFKEYREIFAQDEALNRRFQKVDVNAPDRDQARAILDGVKVQLEQHHHVTIHPDALDAALDLSARYLPDRQWPDKAIDVLDEASALARLAMPPQTSVGRGQIETVIAQMAQVPVGEVSQDSRAVLRDLHANLSRVIFGQEPAIQTVVNAVKMARAGLRSPLRPLANLLFAGPTGVGKTELTREMARQLGLPLLRFDMSEYMEAHAVARLIGSPPGYIGHEKGGLLTEQVQQHPHAIVLLDEIEKAHPDIALLLLQVMDHGCLTDGNGREVDFRHVILILTTNAGAQVATRRSLGFLEQDHRSDAHGAIEARFPPEFRSRLDEVVMFNRLGAAEIDRVVDKAIRQFAELLAQRGLDLVVEPEARQWLATHGYNESLGARRLERLVETQLKQPLVDHLLFAEPGSFDRVVFTCDGEGLRCTPMRVADLEVV